MGEAKSKAARFLQENAYCCFCGGETLATTVDHVPSRATFPMRAGPEGFEFPACVSCQTRYRAEEHYFAFIARISDQDNANYDRETSRRLIRGIKNNLPQMLPDIGLPANKKRRAIRNLGLSKPQGMLLRDVPIAAFPINADEMIRKVGVKVGLALFYKQKGHAAHLDYQCCSYWTQASDISTISRWREIASEFQGVEWGSRKNLDFGNRFRYGWAEEEPNTPEIFFTIAEFGKGISICTMIWDSILGPEVNDAPENISVADWSRGVFPEGWPRGQRDNHQ